MKTIFYVVIPVFAIFLILINIFYGHLLFKSDSVINKYSIYVHLQPEWNSGSKNIIFDITNVWYKSNSDKIGNTNDYLTHNSNQVKNVNNRSYIELKHGFSDCHKDWQPMLYRKVIDSVRHKIEYVQGTQLSTNQDITIYPDITNNNYDESQQQIKIKEGYVQFIPICTSKDITSYDYSIRTDNNDIGFDVYFVSSYNEMSNSNFTYYEKSLCFAQNKQSYSGTCNDLKKGSGLLIILPDDLTPWVTKMTIDLYEKN